MTTAECAPARRFDPSAPRVAVGARPVGVTLRGGQILEPGRYNMPTGYTAKLMEQGQTFEEFVLTCARAFGALVMMRDESPDAPIPEAFEPSDYYALSVAGAKERLAELRAMTPAEQDAWAEAKRAEGITYHDDCIKRYREQNARLADMAARVSKWQPPTPDHQDMKTFMLDQISISKEETGYHEVAKAQLAAKSPAQIYTDALVEATQSLARSEKNEREEIDRVNKRNAWVKALRDSLTGS